MGFGGFGWGACMVVAWSSCVVCVMCCVCEYVERVERVVSVM